MYRAIKTASQLPLETELYSLISSVLDHRTVQIACRLYGFDDRGGATLQETGDEFHLTRERVRQICRPLSAVSESRPFLPTLSECIKLLRTRTTDDDNALEIGIQQRGLTQKPFKIAGIRKAGELFNMSVSPLAEQLNPSTHSSAIRIAA